MNPSEEETRFIFCVFIYGTFKEAFASFDKAKEFIAHAPQGPPMPAVGSTGSCGPLGDRIVWGNGCYTIEKRPLL
jgi:hypothetical protein